MGKGKMYTAEEIFYETVTNLIRNFFTMKNPNFKSYYYAKKGGFEFQEEVVNNANYILQKMEDIKHLIIDDNKPNSNEQQGR